MFFINLAFYAVPANVALFMKEQCIGIAQSAGTVISVFMIAGFIAGVALSYIQKYLKHNSVLFGIGIMAFGYIVLSLAHNLFLVILGSGLVGFSFGILFPSLIILITNKCSSNSCILALSFSSCAQFLGQFISPYTLQLIKNIFGLSSLRNDFVILAISLSISCLIYLAIKILMKYKLTH